MNTPETTHSSRQLASKGAKVKTFLTIDCFLFIRSIYSISLVILKTNITFLKYSCNNLATASLMYACSKKIHEIDEEITYQGQKDFEV
ncbi:hypothetical protein SYNTR_0942 [Candidatus Syntrophocurvum alkaliphilum]|uniref:Uncharacterized protein n=1 Tax=Candidatus Syntrophocurvum alkaliphilum TaxID=2293317 RepID=A0A6I6D9T2_9FIRM|nr:hypothetical protein SYNTR_0942 [Candidatus Syntrophocurvum alkaliphilum]